MSLSAPEQVLTLSPADAEDLASKVTTVIQGQEAAGLISADVEREMFLEITKAKLTGLTPSQALQKIIEATQNARTTAVLKSNYALITPVAGDTGRGGGGSAKVSPLKPGETPQANSFYVVSVASAALSKAGEEAEKAKGDQVQIRTDSNAKIAGATLIPEPVTSQNVSTIVNAARDTVERLVRPIDVGCAMSVLSYNEVSKAYGYIIANNYIAVQVVVRNLNRDQQFVLHDVEYSVNTDPNGTIGRYYSGRDKVVVRSLATAESSFDPRNLIVHTAQGIGAILTTLVPIFGGPVGDAASVYTGGFVVWLDKAWKDLSTDQLNLLNDTGFTSQSNSQTVVPKADKAMFVTFIPSKQFERGWWTLDCVKAAPLGVVVGEGKIRALEPFGPNTKVASTLPFTPVEEAIQACATQAYGRLNTKTSRAGSLFDLLLYKDRNTSFEAKSLTGKEVMVAQACDALRKKQEDGVNLADAEKADLLRCDAPVTLFTNVPKRVYRHWNGNSVSLFQELSTIVISGMHIIEETELQANLLSIDCKKTTAGDIIFPFPDTGSVTCPLKGKNLAKVSGLRLRSKNESAYTDGTVVATSGDDTSGTVTFSSGLLHALNQTEYDVYVLNTVNKSTSEAPTTQTMHFDVNPFITKVDPDTLDVKKGLTPPVMTLSGYHLDKLDSVRLYTTDEKVFALLASSKDAGSTDRVTKVSVLPAELQKIGSGSEAKMDVMVTGKTDPVALPITIKLTGGAAAAGGAAPAVGAPAAGAAATAGGVGPVTGGAKPVTPAAGALTKNRGRGDGWKIGDCRAEVSR